MAQRCPPDRDRPEPLKEVNNQRQQSESHTPNPSKQATKKQSTNKLCNHTSKPQRAAATATAAPAPDELATQNEFANSLATVDNGDEENQPAENASLAEDSLVGPIDALSVNAAALHDELDLFRQRWKRELEATIKPATTTTSAEPKARSSSATAATSSKTDNESSSKTELNQYEAVDSADNKVAGGSSNERDSGDKLCTSGVKQSRPEQVYAEAKRLFLRAAALEQDDLHHESIRYYKQAMHLCPDIEKQIFKEQLEASVATAATAAEQTTFKPSKNLIEGPKSECNEEKEQTLPLYEAIRRQVHSEEGSKSLCLPVTKSKASTGSTKHISDLPPELVIDIFHYVIGDELDLASLEALGLVCRGFFLMSRDQSLWRSICHRAWPDFLGNDPRTTQNSAATAAPGKVDSGFEIEPHRPVECWRRLFIEKPRVNFDGVYISRTRYIRQGDTGFQDVTYRPFHVIRYYRYLRFFPDRRCLILTTSEEPDRIVPIFRHALNVRQISSELSALEGHFELIGDGTQVSIVADKDCRSVGGFGVNGPVVGGGLPQSRSRQAQLHWSRQTPISQRFSLKFELRTSEAKPYRNNVLKWLEYTILSKFETGPELTNFDLTPEAFPNLIFSRIKRFNLRLSNPLSKH